MAMPATKSIQAPLRPKRAGGNALARYGSARQQAVEAFVASSRIAPLWRNLTKATDALLASALGNAKITLIAVGGYGRCELFPFSDVDVLLLVDEGDASRKEAQVVALLQQLWDMHVPVSHATRTKEETVALAKSDASIATALMDARFLAGDRRQFLALKKELKRDVFGNTPRDFVEAKLRDRDLRHARTGASRFLLEPNVKESKGSLRDLQTLSWLVRYCYGLSKASELMREDLLNREEWQHYRDAYMFFATVRAHLHALRGRADDKLTFDAQLEIATRLKFPGRTAQEKAERLMMRYFDYARKVGTLTRIFCAILEDENLRIPQAPFAQEQLARELPPYLTVQNGRLQFSELADIEARPSEMIGLFCAAHQHGVDIHPRAQLKLARTLAQQGSRLPLDGEANQLFLQLLTAEKSPDMVLRRMNDMGVIAALIPEFARITGQMQYDGYHTYTVDEHTLVAVSNLHAIESGIWREQFPLATALAKDITHRTLMYLAMLCHDIAKGTGGGHADKGEAMVQHIAARFSFTPEDAQLAGWLVKHHLLLSEIAFKRDLDDPQTIADLVSVVQSPERLRLLLLITAADIKAVGPNIWNGWKGSLLRTLAQRALVQMGVGQSGGVGDARAERLLAAWQKASDVPVVEITHDAFRAVSEITCCVAQQKGLAKALAGVMAWIGASIVSARIEQHEADHGLAALAFLAVQDAHGESFAEEEHRLEQLPKLMTQALAGKLAFTEELPKRRRVKKREREVVVKPGVFIDNQVSVHASVIEVNARDRLGLLHDIFAAMEQAGLQVMSSHISTYGAMAVDVFYVKDHYGLKLAHWDKQAEVQGILMKAIGDGR